MAGWSWKGGGQPSSRRDDRSEQELLAEIVRHVRGVAIAVYLLVGLAVFALIVVAASGR